jgi:hypothetical protein
MNEDVLAALIRGDEAIPLRIVEPLNGSGCHICTPPLVTLNVLGGADLRTRYTL